VRISGPTPVGNNGVLLIPMGALDYRKTNFAKNWSPIDFAGIPRVRIMGPTSIWNQCEIAISGNVLILEPKGVKFGVRTQYKYNSKYYGIIEDDEYEYVCCYFCYSLIFLVACVLYGRRIETKKCSDEGVVCALSLWKPGVDYAVWCKRTASFSSLVWLGFQGRLS